jgi:hypothetical protein
MMLVSHTRLIEIVLLCQKSFLIGFLVATEGLESVVRTSAALNYQMTVLVRMHFLVCLSLVNCLKSGQLLKRKLGIEILMKIIEIFDRCCKSHSW